ncbi:class I SAM-dependent methyltransferase [Phytoactinopolyspora alkaliphila]|uniref:Class I SAM-dependent methyltransferase n=1 Tax=Phytoactinopolyspora alkaliphila TaxID=1783498 RepID=A0A6N9YUG1_9ACTN|nr:class I SAM-dependent methyltransferase [Phytoactinopolyspora alkaliphila]NED98448.1 class I SAM-dependent methyltransferase [Phytoactinopolyspora alkaliphila]
MDAADFYTGLVAELYGPLKAHAQVAEPYARFITEHGQPALELGCGDGEPMLELRRLGLDVEGLDSSSDLLDRCRRRAATEGLDIVVHHQRMEDVDLPRRYRSIFLAGPTFTLLPDDDTSLRALQGIHRHLHEEGTAMIPLFVPTPVSPDDLGRTTETTSADGATLRVACIAQDRDEVQRTQKTMLRYERIRDGEHTVVDRLWTLHWHTPAGFASLAAQAGLNASDVRIDHDEPSDAVTEFTFFLRKE